MSGLFLLSQARDVLSACSAVCLVGSLTACGAVGDPQEFEESADNFGTIQQPVVITSDIQYGIASVQTSSRSDWDQVTFTQAFSSTPRVFVGTPTHDGGQPVTVRVRNVDRFGFEVQTLEWDYLDGSHTAEEIEYLAMRGNSFDLGGIQAAGRTVSANHDWGTIVPPVDDPIVFATQVTDNGSDATTVRLRTTGSGDIQYRLQEEEASDGAHTSENVHLLFFERGFGSAGQFQFQTSSVDIDDDGSDFADFVSALSYMQTYNGSDPAALRRRDAETCGGGFCLPFQQVFVEEEQSDDSETNHALEEVGFVTINLIVR